MGCELGKLASSGGENKKDVENGGNLNEPPAPAAPDPRLPLTARQKYTMMASWKGISRAMEPTGINMFIRYVFEFFIALLVPSIFLIKN
jgi:neuroglobin